LPTRMLSTMAVYLNTDTGNGNSFDRILWPISTYEYAALPNKEQQAPPTSYWYSREITPVMTVWPVPDDNATYTLKVRILSQMQDAKAQNGINPQIPFRWFDAFTAALAARLAAIYKPELEDKRKVDAERAWQIAAKEDTEAVPVYFIPMLGGYSR